MYFFNILLKMPCIYNIRHANVLLLGILSGIVRYELAYTWLYNFLNNVCKDLLLFSYFLDS